MARRRRPSLSVSKEQPITQKGTVMAKSSPAQPKSNASIAPASADPEPTVSLNLATFKPLTSEHYCT
jgi:hypothetical protein